MVEIFQGTPVALSSKPFATNGASSVVGVGPGNEIVRSPATTINAADFGVRGDGQDYTAELDKAFTEASASEATLVLPFGEIGYSGAGWNSPCPQIIGQSQQGTIVNLGGSSRLIDSDQAWGTLRFERMKVIGGLGAIRNTFTGTNVAQGFFVRDCYFKDYTKAAIETNAQDMPNWAIQSNQFYALDSTASMGIALAGWQDGSTIFGNEFLDNKVDIKIGRGGQNLLLNHNAHIHARAGTSRIAVWFVPVPSGEYQISGQGMVLENAKFGNENLDASDYAIIYADEGSGATVGDRLPVFTSSVGIISGHTIRDSAIFCIGSPPGSRSLVYTTTKNVRGCQIGDIKVCGTPVKYLLEYLNPPTEDVYNQNNVLGPAIMMEGQFAQYNAFSMTNGVGVATILDATGVSALDDMDSVHPYTVRGTANTGLTNLFTSQFSGAGVSGTASITGSTDPDGGNDCAEITFTAGVGSASKTFNVAAVTGVPIWIEFDLQPGSSSSLTKIKISVVNNTSGATVYQEWMKVPAASKSVRRQFTPRSIPAGNFKFVVENVSSAAGKVKLARTRLYQSKEPASGNFQYSPLYLTETLSVPNTPTAGGYMFVQGGVVKWVGPSSSQEVVGRGRYYFNNTVFDGAGLGTPEGSIAAGVGSTWHRTDGGAGTSFYVKETGTGNTGWVAK
jgi:hypothetical protein